MNVPLIVGDLGNSSLKLGEFSVDFKKDGVLVPMRTFRSLWNDLCFDHLDHWICRGATSESKVSWRLGSVNQSALPSLVNWIQNRGEQSKVISHADFAMPIVLRYPDRVGIDRLAAAWAANAMRPAHCAAIIVDAGTAITVDCVSASGQFLGGTIAPGMQLQLQSLNNNTDQLPLSKIESVPSLVGKDTLSAIQSGTYWMTVEGIKGLIEQLKTEMAGPCDAVGTGGAMPILLPNLDRVRHAPHLVLSGLAMANQ